ncbi:MAG: prepilin-type N-terminal cleavage/methylation domain-containing protein [Candidatus Staskawiczbacteria bacterium]|nr:prepilin-type N-terminal cleavage/methylation domain-containing protein [Candidatus Staskawiczbacteria bacterium]
MNIKMNKNKFQKGFTLVELLVVLVIIIMLSSFILYNVMRYMNKGRDATVKGNLVILVTAGELWYDKNNSNYTGFCGLDGVGGSDVVTKAFSQIPSAIGEKHCKVKDTGTAWAACAREFVDSSKAYCVDNKGNQKDINKDDCAATITNCCFSGITNCIP